MDKKLLFLEKAYKIHGDKYDYSNVVYVNCKTKVDIICKIHGVFKQTPDKHINLKCGCPYCANNVRFSTNQFITKAKIVHGDKYNYDNVVYVNNRTNVDIFCHSHGFFKQKPYNHLNGRGCPYCSIRQKSNYEFFVNDSNVKHNNFYDYSLVNYVSKHDKVNIICPKHGLFKQSPYLHLKGHGCPKCGLEKTILNRDVKAVGKSIKSSFINKYGVENPMFLESIKNKHKKIVNSCYVRDKANYTKRKNNSFNTSSHECKVYSELCNRFGENDIVKNYKSNLYPFNCDFYVKSTDCYIELNIHWTHGGHWFDSNSDKCVIDKWSHKNSSYYKMAISVFTNRDVIKRDFAKSSKLNYVVFWKYDLSDFYEWLLFDCPMGHDYDCEYSWKK